MAKKSKKKEVERLSGIRGARDLTEVAETFGRAFAGPAWMERHMTEGLLKGAIYDPEHTRVVVVDGRVVSAVTMGPRMIRFGPVSVPGMTFGPVGTHDAYHKKGYSFEAMNDASRYMAENGYLVAYLQGIPNYYHRYGFYPFLAPSNAKFNRDRAAKESRPGRLRKMRRTDLRSVRRVYDAATADRICSADRDDAVWDWLIGPGSKTWIFSSPRVIVDARGRVCGYLTAGERRAREYGEIIVRPDEAAFRVALGVLAKEARKRETKDIVLRMPWDDAFGVFIRQHVDAEWQTWSASTGGALMKVVDFPALMRAMGPLFTQRWKAAARSGRVTAFTMKCELGAVGFSFPKGRVRVGEPGRGPVVHVPQRWLSGLVSGYHAVKWIAPRKGTRVPDRLLPVMATLFPQGWPFVYQGDNY